MVCSEQKIGLGTCFDSRRELTADEVDQNGLAGLDYAPSIKHDFDHDGLLDSISVTQPTLIYGQLNFANGREHYNLKPKSHYTLDVFRRSDAAFSATGIELDPAAIAVHDFTGTGQADLIVREQELAGNFRYFVYENHNPPAEEPSIFEGPTFHAIRTVNDSGARTSQLLETRQYELRIQRNNAVIDLLGFHPGTLGLIHYYQLNDGPIIRVSVGDPVVLQRSRQYRYPLSLTDQFTVHLRGKVGDIVQSFEVEQDIEDHLERHQPKGGPEFIIYHVPGREAQIRFDENTEAMVTPVIQKLDQLKALWGSVVVDGTVQQVVFIDDERSKLKGTGDQLEYSTAFVVPIAHAHESNALAVLHEAVHNFEITWLRDRNGGALQATWQQLTASHSMVFEFLNEKNFFPDGQGGHSQANTYELFASLTVDLLQGPEALESALSRWDATHTAKEQRQLRRDLRTVFDAYKAVLRVQAPRESRDFLAPYYRSL